MRLVALSLFLASCVPLPDGVPLSNAGTALDLALTSYGVPGMRLPVVYGVPADCLGEEYKLPGFVNPDTGTCVSGTHYDGEIWLVLAPGYGYSYALCHEVAHYVWGSGGQDHKRRTGAIWGPLGRVQACNAELAAKPEIDTIEVSR